MLSLGRLLGRGLALCCAFSYTSATVTKSNTTDGIKVTYKEVMRMILSSGKS